MIFGNDKVGFQFVQNGNISEIYSPKLCSVIFDWNIPDILLQRAINGHVIKIVKGYYSKFTVTVYDYDENDLELMLSANYFYSHIDNPNNLFRVNKISKPFYISEINGFDAVTFEIETALYTDLVTV